MPTYPARPSELKINFGLDWQAQQAEQDLPEKHLAGFTTKLIGEEYPIIKPGGQWPTTWNRMPAEIQMGERVETMSCVSFGTNNILEMIWLDFFKKDFNLSDRFLAKVSGTSKSGNTVDAPIDAVRKKGFLFEKQWMWDLQTFDWNTFFATIPANLLAEALKQLIYWEFSHQYVPHLGNTGRQAMMKALETSPLGCTVYAWASYDGIYYDYGYRPNHFTTIIGYVEGKYWIIGDSYPTDYQISNTNSQEYIKKLDWDYNFGCVKRYKIIPKTLDKQTLLIKLKNMILQTIKMNYFINKNMPDSPENRANGEVYICKKDKKKKVQTIDDVIAMVESAFGEMGVYMDKTDWPTLSKYETTNKF